MKAQISRDAHKVSRHYTGVYQQQGRMITDADWNALTDIEKQQLVSALTDAIASGAPRNDGLGLNLDGTIQPGMLYVDGHHAELDGPDPVALDTQIDYPQPPALPTNNLIIYADLWERTVTALEDAELMDAALHGADTTARSQQMLQVKWTDNGSDPTNAEQNPPRGTSRLALRLRKILVGSDPCDPCASEVDLDERVGNYLFRVEVHDVFLQAGETLLVLKWSRDNGAEAYPAENIPDGFDVGDWVWEFFDSNSEKTLGHHFPPAFRPRRGVLETEFILPGGAQPGDFVRQWDGYAIINLSTESLVEGVDRGAELGGGLSVDAHGFIGFNSGLLTINSELMEVTLRYQDGADRERFLAGDFWQTPVREAVRNPGDYVLGSDSDGETPAGILHHYLVLGELDAGGNVVPLSDPLWRQFNFPPLTDITARDVGFSDNCPGLYAGAENVQAALDALCAIGAEDIAWTDPGCPDSVRELLGDTLGAWPDLDADGKTSVKDALDALLCHLNLATLPHDVPDCGDDASPTVRSLLPLAPGIQPSSKAVNALLCQLNATHIPLDKSRSICPALDQPSIQTVQQALQTLCERSGGACAIPVEPGDQLQELLRAFANNEATEIWLCLRPGEHVIAIDLKFADKASIKLVGAGRTVSQVRFTGTQLALAARELHLEDVGFYLSSASAHLALQADTLSACHCEFERATGSGPSTTPLLSWLPLSDNRSDVSIHWVDNRMSTYWRRLLIDPGLVAPPNIVGPAVSERFVDIFSNEALLADERAMRKATRELAEEIAGMPPRAKARWAASLDNNLANFNRDTIPAITEVVIHRTDADTGLVRRRAFSTVRPVVTDRPLVSSGNDLAIIGRDAIAATSVKDIVDRLDDFVVNTVAFEYNVALSLASAEHCGAITDNQIYGDVNLLSGQFEGEALSSNKLQKLSLKLPVSPQGQLRFSGNRVHRVSTQVASGHFDGVALVRPVAGYQRLIVTDNTFLGEDNAFIGAQMTLQGNDFPKGREQHDTGIALCNMGTFTTNMGINDDLTRFVVAAPTQRAVITEHNLLPFIVMTP